MNVRLRRQHALVLALAGASGIAAAQPAPSAIADCHRIPTSNERLACYDSVSGRTAPATTAAPAPAAPAAAPGVASEAGRPDAMSAAVHKEAAENKAPSLIDASWGFYPDSQRYDIRFYRANYFLVGRYTDRVNNAPYIPLAEALGEPAPDLDSTEAKFQLSFKSRVFATDDRQFGVWVGYTQQNQWQVYNADTSRPFRETNYMPELFVSWNPNVDLGAGFRWKLLNAGYNHQSNGRTDPLSRSWNRLFAEFGVERENLALFGKVWYRLEGRRAGRRQPRHHGLLRPRRHRRALPLARATPSPPASAATSAPARAQSSSPGRAPPLAGPFRGYVQVFSGYGESLIDYNWKQTTIGAGVALSDGL